MGEWCTARVPKEMMDEIERFMKTEKAKKAGFTSKTQIFVTGVRDLLQKYSK